MEDTISDVARFKTRLNDIHQKLVDKSIDIRVGIAQLKALSKHITPTALELYNIKARVDNQIGVLFSIIGEYESSSEYYSFARDGFEQAGLLAEALQADLNIALNRMRFGSWGQLAGMFRLIVERGQKLQNQAAWTSVAYGRLYECACRIKLGNVPAERLLADVESLRVWLEDNATRFDAENMSRLRIETHLTLADLHCRKGSGTEALHALTSAESYLGDDIILSGMVAQMRGDIYTQCPYSDPDAAYEQARQCYAKAKTSEFVGHAFFSQGYSYAQRGQRQRAIFALRQAISAYAGHTVVARMREATMLIDALTERQSIGERPCFIGE